MLSQKFLHIIFCSIWFEIWDRFGLNQISYREIGFKFSLNLIELIENILSKFCSSNISRILAHFKFGWVVRAIS